MSARPVCLLMEQFSVKMIICDVKNIQQKHYTTWLCSHHVWTCGWWEPLSMVVSWNWVTCSHYLKKLTDCIFLWLQSFLLKCDIWMLLCDHQYYLWVPAWCLDRRWILFILMDRTHFYSWKISPSFIYVFKIFIQRAITKWCCFKNYS